MASGDDHEPRLFLSYSRHQHDDVEHLASVMRRAGFAPFVDQAGLEGGHPWWDQLLLQIKHCDAFVPILSRHYMNSTPCRREAEWAEALNKPVLPVMIESVEPTGCPEYIARSQFVTFTATDNDALIALTRALYKLPPCPPLPDPLPTPPLAPISPTNALIASARERVESSGDLAKSEQMVLLGDLKSLLARSPESACDLMQQFKNRDDVTANIYAEITSILDTTSTPKQQPQPPKRQRQPTPEPVETQLTEGFTLGLSTGERVRRVVTVLVLVVLAVGAIGTANYLSYANTDIQQIARLLFPTCVVGIIVVFWWDRRMRRRVR